MEIDLRVALTGRERTRSLGGIAVAGGLAALVLILSGLPVSVGELQMYQIVLFGVGLACWWAYWNSGLLVSIALVMGPVLPRLAYWEIYYTVLRPTRVEPVSLPLSFGGSGAWLQWILIAMLLGLLAFGAGVLARWSRLRLRNAPNSVT
jgi:hypothetical protein